MSRIRQKPSEAQQRDAELAQVEAELKAAREQLEAVNAEIRRSETILMSLTAPPAAPERLAAQFDGAMATFPFPLGGDSLMGCGGDESSI